MYLISRFTISVNLSWVHVPEAYSLKSKHSQLIWDECFDLSEYASGTQGTVSSTSELVLIAAYQPSIFCLLAC